MAAFFCFQGMTNSVAQNTITSSGVHAMACVKNDRVLVRWSPTTPIAWQYAIKYGYLLERITIVKNGKLVPPKSAKKLSIPFKLAPQADFTSAFFATKDSMIAIGLQASYGKSFIAKSQNPNIYEAIEKTKEIEQRFVFSMYAAGVSHTTAKLMGVFYVDSLVEKGEKYLYRVFIPVNLEGEKLDTGAVFADADQPTEYPRNRSLRADFNKKQVKLSWEYALHQRSYAAYIVERSEDGVNFSPITPRPYAPLTENPRNSTMYFVDTLPRWNQKYYFRIYGRTYFGEHGPYSNIVFGKGIEGLPEAPKIMALTEPKDQKVKVEWSLPEAYNRLVREFQVKIAPAPGKPGQITVVKDLTQRSLILPAPYPSNYVSISALGMDSTLYSSPQRLHQLKDVTPPAAPKDYKARIDTQGVLTITWAKNKELDIYGYRVYYANAKHEELVQPRPLIFKDT
ncbi:MAG: hypothetical protein K2Q22_05760, partial [Cytophagales bacterium]|nr:hypothetical protein [Cytophagales bacterium]